MREEKEPRRIPEKKKKRLIEGMCRKKIAEGPKPRGIALKAAKKELRED